MRKTRAKELKKLALRMAKNMGTPQAWRYLYRKLKAAYVRGELNA